MSILKNKSSKNKIWLLCLRTLVLAILFAGVILAIKKLKQKKYRHRINNVMHITPKSQHFTENPQKQSDLIPLTGTQSKLLWCYTRVHSLSLPEGRVEEKNRKWIFTPRNKSKNSREIPYLQMEKWMASHCSLVTLALSAKPSKEAFSQQALCVDFIDKKNLSDCFYKTPDSLSLWRWKKTVFGSVQLRHAILELQKILKI